jgi:hypothetical protein
VSIFGRAIVEGISERVLRALSASVNTPQLVAVVTQLSVGEVGHSLATLARGGHVVEEAGGWRRTPLGDLLTGNLRQVPVTQPIVQPVIQPVGLAATEPVSQKRAPAIESFPSVRDAQVPAVRTPSPEAKPPGARRDLTSRQARPREVLWPEFAEPSVAATAEEPVTAAPAATPGRRRAARRRTSPILAIGLALILLGPLIAIGAVLSTSDASARIQLLGFFLVGVSAPGLVATVVLSLRVPRVRAVVHAR